MLPVGYETHSSQYCVATADCTAAIVSPDGAAAKPAVIGLVARCPPAAIVRPPLPANGEVIELMCSSFRREAWSLDQEPSTTRPTISSLRYQTRT